MITEEDQCRSLRKTMLHKEGKKVIYLRCESREGHEGKNHRSWMRKWTDDEEDGWLEDDYND